MWGPGEDGQEASSLQELPETGLRSVAQEQVKKKSINLFETAPSHVCVCVCVSEVSVPCEALPFCKTNTKHLAAHQTQCVFEIKDRTNSCGSETEHLN